MELELPGFQLNGYLAKLRRLIPFPLCARDRQSQEREVVGVMLVGFKGSPLSYERLLGILVLEELDTFFELSGRVELGRGFASLFRKSEVHGVPS